MPAPVDSIIEGESGQFLDSELPRPTSKLPPPPGKSTVLVGSPSDPGFEGDEEPDGMVQKVLRQSAHPTVAVVHVSFKLAPIASYLLIGLFTKMFVVQFVVTVTLLAFDFWIVKNLTGRLLVGLRWWHELAEDGITQKWRFETVQDRESLNVVDGRIFWWTLYICPIVWIILGVVCVLKMRISYLIMIVIALVLSAANIVGYYKCNKDATEQIRNYIGKTMLDHAMSQSSFGRISQYL